MCARARMCVGVSVHAAYEQSCAAVPSQSLGCLSLLDIVGNALGELTNKNTCREETNLFNRYLCRHV